MALLPKPANIGAVIERLKRSRPPGQAVEIALKRAAGAEGVSNERHPQLLKRLSLKTKVPTIKMARPKLGPIRPPRP